MKKHLLFFTVLVISFTATNAQSPSWQWAKSGGSADNSVSSGTGNEEDVYDMATDPHGNIYVLATVQQTAANVDGHTIPTWGDRDNVVLTSFRCDGTYRWSKVFGNNNGGGEPVALKTDPSGGIYIAIGIDNYDAVHLDTDSTIPYAAHLRQLLFIKYDTAGHLKWAHWPEPDTLSYAGIMAFNHDLYDITLDEAGNVYFLCLLSPGAYCDGAYVISTPGETMHLLKYSSAGVFLSGIPMAISVTGYPPMALKMKKNQHNGRVCITGQLWDIAGGGTLTFGSTLVSHNMFVGCFDSTGALIWQKQSANVSPSYADATFEGIDMDAAGDIYLTGHIRNNDTFNTYVCVNAFTTIPYSVPIIVKMDSNGNNLWAKNAYEDIAETWSAAIAVNGNEVAITGACGGTFTWPGFPDTLYDPINTYLYNVFVARFNTETGTMLGMDTVASPLMVNEYPHAIAADKYGNFYVGGMFEYQMFFSCGDTLTSIGGETDFFVAKYGTSNCDTLHIPALETSPQPSPKEREMVRVYPNPVTEELTISASDNIQQITITNLLGQMVYSREYNTEQVQVHVADLPTGVYFIKINGSEVRKFVKE